MIPEAEFRPEKLRPREGAVRHLLRPKSVRATSAPPKHDTILHHDSVEEWELEDIEVLKQQLRLRPGIKITQTDLKDITNHDAIIVIRNYDKKHPPK